MAEVGEGFGEKTGKREITSEIFGIRDWIAKLPLMHFVYDDDFLALLTGCDDGDGK